MVAFPKSEAQEVTDRIYAAIEASETNEEVYLGRLGSSSIGGDCLRATWLSWRAYDSAKFGGRMLRLFGTGHWQEDRIVEDLKRAGFQIWEKDHKGEQFQFVDVTGHFISKMDGVLKGYPGSTQTPHVLEIKTHNKSSFSAVVKHGVLKSKPKHYAQVQSSMMLSGMNRAIYVALCKDDEQFYVERIKEDKPAQKALSTTIIKLVEARLKPAGISDEPLTSKLCMFCDVKEVCAGIKPAVRTCRSCRANCAVENGEWRCELHDKILSKDEQRATCASYEVL